MTRALSIPTFETERLCLCEPRATDFEAFVDFFATERSRFVGGPSTDRWAVAKAYGHMAGLWLLRGYGSHIWCLKDGTVIGHGGLWYPQTWPEPEFGWCLWDGVHEGKGYVSEAMAAIWGYAFETLNLAAVVAYIDPQNAASISVAQRLGGILDPDAATPGGDPDLTYRFTPQVAA
ncbi:MAG: GNAT family N-acetyltransferase [Rhodobacteraceae bacterium]|nr:GNAT family N-acetyltransferase [Paracoccaceae bacterium]